MWAFLNRSPFQENANTMRRFWKSLIFQSNASSTYFMVVEIKRIQVLISLTVYLHIWCQFSYFLFVNGLRGGNSRGWVYTSSNAAAYPSLLETGLGCSRARRCEVPEQGAAWHHRLSSPLFVEFCVSYNTPASETLTKICSIWYMFYIFRKSFLYTSVDSRLGSALIYLRFSLTNVEMGGQERGDSERAGMLA